ncbi:hypothetical protein HOO65_010796 [Ceratocystis lukuohia]|uniref:Uncharacterized protein n=1 Tax=Ceratocystis lukuohia TaxID=2019550 RepID=A0ABR4MT40_9PEZI
MKLLSLALIASATLASTVPMKNGHLRLRAIDYEACQGNEAASTCPQGQTCTPDPRQGYGGSLICVPSYGDNFCGGFAGFGCSGDTSCFDYPYDDCDPDNGGADCGGWCI